MLRCSLIAGVFAATVALSACGASEAVPPTSAPVETPPTVTSEAAWAIEDAYHSFGNPDAGVVVVNS